MRITVEYNYEILGREGDPGFFLGEGTPLRNGVTDWCTLPLELIKAQNELAANSSYFLKGSSKEKCNRS